MKISTKLVIAAFGFIGCLAMVPVHATAADGWSSASGAAAPDGFESAMPLLKGADAAAGEKTAKACVMCHSVDKGGPKKMGPNLFGIMGKASAIKGMKGKWTDEAMDSFLFSPKEAAAGNKMMFSGIKSAQDRANVVAWLHTKK